MFYASLSLVIKEDIDWLSEAVTSIDCVKGGAAMPPQTH